MFTLFLRSPPDTSTNYFNASKLYVTDSDSATNLSLSIYSFSGIDLNLYLTHLETNGSII